MKAFTSAMMQYGLAERDCEFPRLDHYITQKTPGRLASTSLPFSPMFNEIQVILNSDSIL